MNILNTCVAEFFQSDAVSVKPDCFFRRLLMKDIEKENIIRNLFWDYNVDPKHYRQNKKI